MTVPDTEFETTLYADGSTTEFEFDFRVITKESVIVVNITQAVTLEYGTAYSVLLNANGVGGRVILVNPQTSGDELHIYRLEDYEQNTDFITQQDLKAEVIETALDKLCIQIQQLNNTNNFILETVIPGLNDYIEQIVSLTGTVLVDGAGVAGSLPLWTGANNLAAGLAPGAENDIIITQGGAWVVSSGIPVLDLGSVVVPGTTSENGIVIWGATDGTELASVDAGEDGEILVGNTGGPPTFEAFLDWVGDNVPSTAGQIIQLNGTGNPATVEDLPAAPTASPSFFSPTAAPVGLKIWSLAKPVDYVVGGSNKARISGSKTQIADSQGSYTKITTNGGLNDDVYFYTTSDDIAATRDALPIWVARFKTGAAVSAIRMWVGFNANERNAMRASGNPTGSTAAFRYDTSVDGTAFWRCVTSDGSSTTTTTTTVAVNADTTYIMAIDMSTPGEVSFLIDGVVVATHTTNLPVSGDFLDWLAICRSLTATVKSIALSVVNMSHR